VVGYKSYFKPSDKIEALPEGVVFAFLTGNQLCQSLVSAARGHLMFINFFGFEEQPFGATPNPKYVFWSRSHREALSTLHYGIVNDRGFVALIAPPGLGKTTLVFYLLEHLRETHQTVFLFQAGCNPVDFIRFVQSELGYATTAPDPVALNVRLNHILGDLSFAGKQLVVVIDEAQNLELPVLETVRLLSNFERPDRKLIQIVLSGQSQLESKLAHPDLVQLRQRILMTARLDPLNRTEIQQYIEHRLSVAGYRGSSLFKPEALDRISTHSKGIPRVINSLCFNSLSLACARHVKTVDNSIMQEAIEEMNLSLPSSDDVIVSSVVNLSSQFPHPRSALSVKPVEPPASPVKSDGMQSASSGHPSRQALRVRPPDLIPSYSLGRPDFVLRRSNRLRRHRVGIAVLLGILLGGAILVYFIYRPDQTQMPDPFSWNTRNSRPSGLRLYPTARTDCEDYFHASLPVLFQPRFRG